MTRRHGKGMMKTISLSTTARIALASVVSWSTSAVIGICADYPAHPIRLVVPMPPGGSADAYARAAARQAEVLLGQPIVIDNRGGANGIIAYSLVAKAAPDGYTLLHTSVSFVINATVYKDLPFDLYHDFKPITNVVLGRGAMFVVHPALPAQSIKEFIAYAKTKRLSYGTPGIGNNLHLITEAFNVKAGTNMLHVPYKGAGPAMNALLGGEVQLMMVPPAVAVPQVKAGRLRALGYSGSKRLEAMPEVPTIAESGLPGFELDTGWHGWFAPAKTPDATVDAIYGVLRKVLEMPKVREFYLAGGYEPMGESPAKFQKIFEADIKRWGDMARLARIEPE
jgi:tripartite-type tricarboxylate transporter receptor subunit TctC